MAEQAQCRPFHHHPLIDDWLGQYGALLGTKFRFKVLLLRGPSRSGKTQKACSRFGFASTFVVNAQGLEGNLPSLVGLDRDHHKALVFDEGSVQQVIGNKQFFQAGARAVSLGQSKCNQFSYSVFVYMLPIIVTSNCFPMTEEEGLKAEDADWLSANLIDIPVPVGGKWWVDDLEEGLDLA